MVNKWDQYPQWAIAAKAVIGQEIANDPQVRRAMRRDWEYAAVVNVKPTTKGFNDIDDLHPMHVSKEGSPNLSCLVMN